MKINWLNKTIFGMFAATAVIFASCSDTNVAEETGNPEGPTEEAVGGGSNLTTVQLATFAGNPSRVTYAGTRAEGDEELAPGTLKLVANIDNPSQAEGFKFEIEKDEDGNVVGRYMSATSVFYDKSTDTYYASYHMQGNNYNTTLENEIAGAIQSFKVAADGTVTLGNGFRAENPDKEDYDFNHLYFDNPESRGDAGSKRIIAVGHNIKDGNSKNTRAIIAEFDPKSGNLTYAPIATAEKIYEDGISLGDEDAGDANCVTSVDTYPYYFVTTRKGIAVLNSDFSPVLNSDGTRYFVPTPGSAKFVFNNPEVGSGMDFLYLSEPHKSTSYETSSNANIATFQVATGANNSFLSLMYPGKEGYWSQKTGDFYDSKELDILSYENQKPLPKQISPTDGKNVVHALSYKEYYAALGTGGMYFHFHGTINRGKVYDGVVKFGNRPVNCVYAERNEDSESVVVEGSQYPHGHDGFIYVANGARLTILNRGTLEVVANWNIPTKDDNGDYLDDVAASANYITVTKAPKGENGLCERTITVAYGQKGVKVFKFMPVTKTVWETDLPEVINY